VTVPGEAVLVVDCAEAQPAWRIPDAAVAAIRASAPAGWRVHVVSAPTDAMGDAPPPPSDEVLAVMPVARAYFGFGLAPALAARAGAALAWVHSGTAGVGKPMLELAARGVTVTTSAGLYAEPIADWVLAGVLALWRGFDLLPAAGRAAGVWSRAPWTGAVSPVREAAECRALVVGLGGIGAAVARRLAACGTVVTGVRRRPALGSPAGVARVVGPEALDTELPLADLVVVAAPLTAQTKRLLDGRRLALLPPGAIVVNVARGALVEEAALADLLAAGRLRGAVLDVFEREPLPPASPLWRMPQVWLTPHVAGVSPRRYWERSLARFLDLWARHAAGVPLPGAIDPAEGY
jgi:phosphoglycerate dehydrogenase-like enzyme